MSIHSHNNSNNDSNGKCRCLCCCHCKALLIMSLTRVRSAIAGTGPLPFYPYCTSIAGVDQVHLMNAARAPDGCQLWTKSQQANQLEPQIHLAAMLSTFTVAILVTWSLSVVWMLLCHLIASIASRWTARVQSWRRRLSIFTVCIKTSRRWANLQHVLNSWRLSSANCCSSERSAQIAIGNNYSFIGQSRKFRLFMSKTEK